MESNDLRNLVMLLFCINMPQATSHKDHVRPCIIKENGNVQFVGQTYLSLNELKYLCEENRTYVEIAEKIHYGLNVAKTIQIISALNKASIKCLSVNFRIAEFIHSQMELGQEENNIFESPRLSNKRYKLIPRLDMDALTLERIFVGHPPYRVEMADYFYDKQLCIVYLNDPDSEFEICVHSTTRSPRALKDKVVIQEYYDTIEGLELQVNGLKNTRVYLSRGLVKLQSLMRSVEDNLYDYLPGSIVYREFNEINQFSLDVKNVESFHELQHLFKTLKFVKELAADMHMEMPSVMILFCELSHNGFDLPEFVSLTKHSEQVYSLDFENFCHLLMFKIFIEDQSGKIGWYDQRYSLAKPIYIPIRCLDGRLHVLFPDLPKTNVFLKGLKLFNKFFPLPELMVNNHRIAQAWASFKDRPFGYCGGICDILRRHLQNNPFSRKFPPGSDFYDHINPTKMICTELN